LLCIKFDVRAPLGRFQVLQILAHFPLFKLLLIIFYLFVQVGGLQNATHENVRYKNTIDGLRTIVRNQGWRQLFHGVSINYIRVMLTLSNQVYACFIFSIVCFVYKRNAIYFFFSLVFGLFRSTNFIRLVVLLSGGVQHFIFLNIGFLGVE